MPVVLVSTKYELHILVMIVLALIGCAIKFVLVEIAHHLDLYPRSSLGTRETGASLDHNKSL